MGVRRDARAEQAPGGRGQGRVYEHAGGGQIREGQQGGAGATQTMNIRKILSDAKVHCLAERKHFGIAACACTCVCVLSRGGL